MIDWPMVISNAIWICGCALALAVASYASWQASVTQRRWRDLIEERGLRLWLNVAAVLFCLGLAATARSSWEAIVWILLTIVVAAHIIRDRRAH